MKTATSKECFTWLLHIILFLNFSCSTSTEKGISSIDTVAVIETGIDYVFKHTSFAPEFYSHPVQIINSNNVPTGTKFMINGRGIKLVDKKAKQFYTKNVFHPLPFVDVERLKMNPNNIIELDLGFPSTGNVYQLKIKYINGKIWKIEELSNYQN